MTEHPATSANSLRRRLLISLLPGLTLAVLLAATASYTLVTRPMRAAFDQSLADTALALLPYIRSDQGRVSLELPEEAARILRSDEFETVGFAVFDASDAFVAGDTHLQELMRQVRHAASDAGARVTGERSFHDLSLDGVRVRMLLVPFRQAAVNATVLVAETTRKRRQRDLQMVIGLLAPLGLLALATVITVWWGTGRGLEPVRLVADQVRQRSSENLAPIDEPKTAEEIRPLVHALNELLSRLGVAQDQQRQFIADAAHQLRTPLASLSILLELATQETGNERERRLQTARGAVQRTIHLAQQLLTLSAAQAAGDGRDNRVDFDLNELVREMAPAWAVRGEQKSIDLYFELSPATVKGERVMIGEAIANLVDNALEYSPNGASVTIRCGADAGTGFHYLEVTDNGPGIPAEFRSRVFDRFFRLPTSTGAGSGLGLAIVHAVAERNAIDVELGDVIPRGLRARLVFRG